MAAGLIRGILATYGVSRGSAGLLAPVILASELDTENLAAGIGMALSAHHPGALRRRGVVIDEETFQAAATQSERVGLILAALRSGVAK